MKLLYINNYHCTLEKDPKYPDYHFWGADYLNNFYKVECAQIPKDIFKANSKIFRFLNRWHKKLYLLFRYRNYNTIYAACGELTDGFAIANILHFGKRNVYYIHHHGSTKPRFTKGYTNIFFISEKIASLFPIRNKSILHWGGCNTLDTNIIKEHPLRYDFISIGKSARDHRTMIEAGNNIDGKTLIVTDTINEEYDPQHVTVISGNTKHKNSLSYDKAYDLYSQSKFIVIPIIVHRGRNERNLAGLTTLIDAVCLSKPVLISDNTNMGIDVEHLNIGFTYKAGNKVDMEKKMRYMLSLSPSALPAKCKKIYVITLNNTTTKHSVKPYIKRLSLLLK